jgi:hypothetical protein
VAMAVAFIIIHRKHRGRHWFSASAPRTSTPSPAEASPAN